MAKKEKWSVKITTDAGRKFNVAQPNLKEALKDIEIAKKHSNFKEIKLVLNIPKETKGWESKTKRELGWLD